MIVLLLIGLIMSKLNMLNGGILAIYIIAWVSKFLSLVFELLLEGANVSSKNNIQR